MRTTRIWLLIGLMGYLLTFTSCRPYSSSSSLLLLKPPKVDGTHVVKVPVLKVIDGDTIRVQLEGQPVTVRLLLIDTPETHHPKLGVQPYGPEASQETHRLLDNQMVILELAKGNGTDKYGRRLAYVFTSHQSVEMDLLQKGLARVAYLFPPNLNHLQDYQRAEAIAKGHHLGVWKVNGYAQEDGFHPEVMPYAPDN